MLRRRHCSFRCGDFGESATDVDSGGAKAGGGVPGDGAGERVVDFEGGGAVSVGCELAAVVRGELVFTSKGEELLRRDVAEGDVAGG